MQDHLLIACTVMGTALMRKGNRVGALKKAIYAAWKVIATSLMISQKSPFSLILAPDQAFAASHRIGSLRFSHMYPFIHHYKRSQAISRFMAILPAGNGGWA